MEQAAYNCIQGLFRLSIMKNYFFTLISDCLNTVDTVSLAHIEA